MITGFNTDVEHDGVVYHVQTEDKGIETPLLLSLVYSGGAILASKRSSYHDLIAAGFDEAVLTERLQRQHRLICAAINAGRIADLKKMGPPLRQPPQAAAPKVVTAAPTGLRKKPPEHEAKLSGPKGPPVARRHKLSRQSRSRCQSLLNRPAQARCRGYLRHPAGRPLHIQFMILAGVHRARHLK